MFFESVAREVRAVSGRAVKDQARWVAFRDYPVLDWVDYLATSAEIAYPDRPLREGLHRLGRSMFPAFARTMVGRVIFSVATGDLHGSLSLYPRIWSVISDHVTAEVDELREGRVVIRQRNVWDFADCFQAGSIEGGFEVFGKQATVRVAMLSPCDADFEVCW